MKAFLALALAAALSFLQAPVHAQPRYYNEPELDALLAPIALYPDALLSQVLMAATFPAEVAEAAAWSRANPQLKGEQAVNAAQNEPWDPSVKSLLAFPEVLARMVESPQWLVDLGQAFLGQEPQVMASVQELRRRAQAAGYLANGQTVVQQEGPNLALYPAQPYVYVPYYDPLVVYGPWWWPAYRPVLWRPWHPAPVFVSSTFFFGGVDWHRRHVTVVRRPVFVQPHASRVVPGKWRHVETRREPAVRTQPTFGVNPPRLQTQPTFGVSAPVTMRNRVEPARVTRSIEPPARVARPIAPAVPVQPGAQRHEWRHDGRRPAGAAPRADESRRGDSRQGPPQQHRDHGRR
jgi:hypothetical protein